MKDRYEPPNPFKDVTDIEYEIGGRVKSYVDPNRVSWFVFRRDGDGEIVEKRIIAESYIKAVINDRERTPNT